jgi:secreted trypsin-like serine protease
VRRLALARTRSNNRAALRSSIHRFGSVLVLAPLACASSSSENVESVDGAIVGGRIANTTHPAVGYLATSADPVPFCTATLVHESYIVTAAHCLHRVRASTIVFGTGAAKKDGPRHRITSCEINPDYDVRDDSTIAYDFAYCELAEPLTGIAPLDFVASPARNASYVAIGYGLSNDRDDDSGGDRKQLAVRRVPADDPLAEDYEDMLAVRSTAGDTCYGDSGGPLLVVGANGKARLAGVLHGGVGDSSHDCAKGNVSLYAPVAENLSFYEAE